VFLDQSLSGDLIAAKILSKIENLFKNVYIVTLDTLTLTLRNCLFIPCHFVYAFSAWSSGLSKKLKKRMQVMQNNDIRYMLNVPPRTHMGVQEFWKMGVLTNLNLSICLTS
jgi:hypothetical protein